MPATPGTDAASIAIRRLLARSYGNLFERGYAGIFQRALDNQELLSGALAAAPPLATVFPATDLGLQLQMIARLDLGARGARPAPPDLLLRRPGLRHPRRPGRDRALDGAHADLLAELDGALAAFYAAMTELGVADTVTAFTASDFGRTYIANGDGSDHGWGGHHFVLGGAVRGGRFYGQMPTLAVDGPTTPARDAGSRRPRSTSTRPPSPAGSASPERPAARASLTWGGSPSPDLGFMG